METFIYIIFCVLSLVGAATIIRELAYLLFKTSVKKKIFTVLLLDDENTEIVIRETVEQTRLNRNVSNKIFALDCGMSESTKKSARLLLDDYNIRLCNIDNIGLRMKNS